jgi:hypothetical protein
MKNRQQRNQHQGGVSPNQWGVAEWIGEQPACGLFALNSLNLNARAPPCGGKAGLAELQKHVPPIFQRRSSSG